MKKPVCVGVFDSGMGGLSVLRECLALAPAYEYYYYGDNLRAPYGNRSEREITQFVAEALTVFEGLKVDAALLACNTATAVCIEEMRRRFSFPVIGIEPALKTAASRYKNVLVLATPRTAESERLHALAARFPQTHFEIYAAEGLAAAIEAHFTCDAPLNLNGHIPKTHCDAAVLGCTHYSLVKEEIADYLNVPVLDGGEGTARRLVNVIGSGINDHRSGIRDHQSLGIYDHLKPRTKTNNCLTEICKFSGNLHVKFLGSGRNINKSVFLSNICFK